MNYNALDVGTVAKAIGFAIRDDQLSLSYQPQINFNDGTLHAVEALLRFHVRELEGISIGNLIVVAEKAGYIEEIGNWVLRRACRQLADWRARGIGIPAVSVNLSPQHFLDRDLPALVRGLLSEYAIPGAALTLEITEGLREEWEGAALSTIAAIRSLGVGFSIDDFGTGYSGLCRLIEVPFSEVKIDRYFVAKLSAGSPANEVVAATNYLARRLNMTVVAEGIETVEQRLVLEALGCQIGQGDLLGLPLGPTDLERWLIDSRLSQAK